MRKACLDMVHELAKRDPRVVYIGSDPGPGTLNAMKKEFPERFFIEGISEQNVIGMAAGLAMEGYIPYVNTISTFLTRRCYEQVAIDVALHKLPVRLIGNGGGVVYAPLGPTHTAVEDMALMRAVPGMTVVAPSDAPEMRRFMAKTLDHVGPIYIRLAKGGDPVISREQDEFVIGKAISMRQGKDVLICSTGVMSGRALAVAETLAGEGISCGVLHLPSVKPLDIASILKEAAGVRLIVAAEEHGSIGGLGSALLEGLNDALPGKALPPVLRLSLPDVFTHKYGSQDGLLKLYGLDAPSIAATIRDTLKS
jgi:transketolase